MTKNPLLNAIAAACYIVAIVLGIFYGTKAFGEVKDTILIPMAMLSLFVLSAATMGFIFLYQPIQLYFDDKKKEAADLFLKTLGSFALITLLFFAALIIVGLR